MVVAIAALVVAMSGTAVAASKLVSGNSLIKKNSLSGNRLQNRSVTGSKIKLKSLGTVPSAKNATNAGDASELAGQPASNYLTSAANRIGTNGIVRVPIGGSAVLFQSGPFQVTMGCSTDGSTTTSTINASSTEAGSDLNGTLAAAGTPTDTGAGVYQDPNGNPEAESAYINLASPSGALAVVSGSVGTFSLNTNGCWANLVGIH